MEHHCSFCTDVETTAWPFPTPRHRRDHHGVHPQIFRIMRQLATLLDSPRRQRRVVVQGQLRFLLGQVVRPLRVTDKVHYFRGGRAMVARREAVLEGKQADRRGRGRVGRRRSGVGGAGQGGRVARHEQGAGAGGVLWAGVVVVHCSKGVTYVPTYLVHARGTCKLCIKGNQAHPWNPTPSYKPILLKSVS